MPYYQIVQTLKKISIKEPVNLFKFNKTIDKNKLGGPDRS